MSIYVIATLVVSITFVVTLVSWKREEEEELPLGKKVLAPPPVSPLNSLTGVASPVLSRSAGAAGVLELSRDGAQVIHSTGTLYFRLDTHRKLHHFKERQQDWKTRIIDGGQCMYGSYCNLLGGWLMNKNNIRVLQSSKLNRSIGNNTYLDVNLWPIDITDLWGH